MARQTIIPLLTFLLATSFGGKQKDELYLNYVAAIKNESTFQYFLVVKVKNLNNALIREYCSKGNFLKGALHYEYNLGYSDRGTSKVNSLAIHRKDRYFEFKNDSAIWNIGGIWRYSPDDLAQLEKTVKFDSLAKQVRLTGKWSMRMVDGKTMIMYAHALFNRGILTGENDCAGGTLVYIDRKKSND